MKTSPVLHLNSIEWIIAVDLGYWSAVCLSTGATEMGRGCRYICICHARAVLRGASRPKRRAFGAAVKSSLARSITWRRKIAA